MADRKPYPTDVSEARLITQPSFWTAGRCNRPPTCGARADYDVAKRKKDSRVHLAVDTLGNLLALSVTPANEPDRDQVGQFVEAIQGKLLVNLS